MVREENGRYQTSVKGRDLRSLLADTLPTADAARQQRFFTKRAPTGTSQLLLQRTTATSHGTVTHHGKATLSAASPGSTTNGRLHISTQMPSGWDWVGANLDDGSALMAFQIRGKDGRKVWAYAGIATHPAALRDTNRSR